MMYLSLNNYRARDFVHRIYLVELEIKDATDTEIGLLHTLTYTSTLTVRGGKERSFTTKEMISIFQL